MTTAPAGSRGGDGGSRRAARASTPPAASPDLRLLAPAAACWGAVWILGGASGRAVLVVAGIALVGAAIARLRAWPVAAVALLAASAGLVSSGVRDLARTSSPLAQLAAVHASAEVRLRVSADPVSVDGSTDGRPWHLEIVAATVLRIDADDGRSWTLSAPVLVLASDGSWAHLVPSQELRTVGDLQPPRAGDDVSAVLEARGPPDHVGPPSHVQRVATTVRSDLRRATSGLPGEQGSLLPALVDGDTAGISSATKDDFRATGLTHLVAVSGENLAILTGVVLAGVRRLRLPPRAATAVTLLVVVAFVVVARPTPSVLRAAVMGGLAAVGLAAGRPGAALRGLSAAVLLLVLLDPSLARQAGFALSVLASLGLLVLAPGLAALLARRLPGWLATAVAVPWAAQVACTPVIAAIGGGVSLTAVPANLVVGPAVAPATLAGVGAAVLGPVLPPLAHAVAWIGAPPCWWLLTVAHVGARIPWSQVPWPSGVGGALLTVGVLVPVCWLGRRGILRT